MATWWQTANDPSLPWTERAQAGLLCGAMPFVCVAEQSAATAQVVGPQMAEARRELVEDARGWVGDVGAEVRETFAGAADAAVEPLDKLGTIAMWGAVALGAVLGLVLLGLLWWYVLLPFVRGGRPAAAP